MELLTQTKRRDFKNCRRYYFLRHEQHLTTRWPKAGRRKGAAFADGLFAMKEGRGSAQAIADRYAEIEPRDQAMADEMEFERVVLPVLIGAYVWHYEQTEQRELEFSHPLVHPRTGRSSRSFRRAGKIDGLYQTGGTDAVLIEDKLVGALQGSMIKRLPLDEQLLEYVDALVANGWGVRVDYRFTRWPSIGLKKAKEFVSKPNVPAESLDEFSARLAADIQERPDFYFVNELLVFPKEALEEYRAERWVVGTDILHARRLAKVEGPAAFYKNPTRCTEWGGCEFLPLCSGEAGAEDLYVTVSDNQELSTEVSDAE